MKPSLYIHIPFCNRKCIYCDFYSVIYKDNVASLYIDVITDQIGHLDQQFSTIYIGGGTPTALNEKLLEKLLKALKRSSDKILEFTIEANPESLNAEKIKLFLSLGANRFSIGVQSVNDQKLKKLGRIHDSKKAIESVCMASKRGFKNISIDLIFGMWNENLGSWRKELEEIVKLPITHVSCYNLTYEKNTPLLFALKNRSFKPLEDEAVAAMYKCAIDILSLHGFKQYEISNFSKDGCQCRHNLNYWENNEYAGLGASAVSYTGGIRSKNVSDVEEYIIRYNGGRSLIESSEKLSVLKRAKETAAVKIRTKEGIDFNWFRNKTDFDFCKLEKGVLPGLIQEGFIKYKKENNVLIGICLKRKGFLFSDTVSSAFL